jgi:hypothetical protein
VTGTPEERERELDPHREEEQRSARADAADRLRDRGIPVHERDSDDDVANLLDAIERFEAAVEALGGDLMVNRIGATEPQNPAFVPPSRGRDKPARQYHDRLLAAASSLRRDERAD